MLDLARTEARVLIAFDKDFGELVYRQGKRASAGIVLFRIAQPSPVAVAERVASTLAARADWAGHFSVVDDVTIRMRVLPER